MTKAYTKAVAGRFFAIKKDYFGNWTIYSANEKFEPITGCPPFSVGHRTKKQAIEFLESFEE